MIDHQRLGLPLTVGLLELLGRVSMRWRGQVRIDGVVITDRALKLTPGAEILLQLGKRGFKRVTLEK